MSSYTRVRVRFNESGQEVLSLATMFGPTARQHLSKTLEALQQANPAAWLEKQCGIQQESKLSQTLCGWKPVGQSVGGAREYELRRQMNVAGGTDATLHVMLGVGAEDAYVRYELDCETVDQETGQVRQALRRALAEVVNPLLRVTVQQAIQQKVEQMYLYRMRSQVQLRVSESQHQVQMMVSVCDRS